MKIKYDIQKKYKEPEIHISTDSKNEQAQMLYQTISGMVNKSYTVYDGQTAVILPVADIVRIYAYSKKVYVRTREQEYEIRERLYTLEEELASTGFVRISNSEIVNIRCINRLDTSHAGTIKMYFKNQDETYVSRRYVGKIKTVLGI